MSDESTLTNARLIEAFLRGRENGIEDTLDRLVIRCKDCKYYDEEDPDNVCGRLCVYFAKPNDFCSKAERREENDVVTEWRH